MLTEEIRGGVSGLDISCQSRAQRISRAPAALHSLGMMEFWMWKTDIQCDFFQVIMVSVLNDCKGNRIFFFF